MMLHSYRNQLKVFYIVATKPTRLLYNFEKNKVFLSFNKSSGDRWNCSMYLKKM